MTNNNKRVKKKGKLVMLVAILNKKISDNYTISDVH